VSPELVYALLNLSVLPWWIVWLAAPRSSLAARSASHAGIFVVLCAAYALLISAAMAGGGLSGGFGFDAMRAALGSELGFLAGWTHYLVGDLFVGAWILRESARLDLEPRPYLVFALLLCPVGLGAFLVRRALHLRSLGRVGEGVGTA
jgi:hypothetical protein